MRHETIWFEAGWFPYRYAFCPSPKAWAHTMSKLRMPDKPPYPKSAGCTSLFVAISDRRPTAIVTVLDRDPRGTIELLAHEAMHVWRDIRKELGEEEPSSEIEAYAIQNILSCLMDAYQKTRGPLFFSRPRP